MFEFVLDSNLSHLHERNVYAKLSTVTMAGSIYTSMLTLGVGFSSLQLGGLLGGGSTPIDLVVYFLLTVAGYAVVIVVVGVLWSYRSKVKKLETKLSQLEEKISSLSKEDSNLLESA